MKKLLTPVAALFIVGSVNATSGVDIYHGSAEGNPDLYSGHSTSHNYARTAVQPGIGSGTGMSRSYGASDNDIYHGFERDNPDLWTGSHMSRRAVASVPGIGSRSSSFSHRAFTDNDTYHGFERDNPDL